jgi:hypothetical protein
MTATTTGRDAQGLVTGSPVVTEVLARSVVRVPALVSPTGARARIDVADVLQLVAGTAVADIVERLAIVKGR